MAYNPNLIFLSPSSIGDFKSCPRRYYYHHIYRQPKTGFKIQVTNPKLALGSAVHDILARFLSPGVEKTKDQLDNILEYSWKNYAGEKGGFENLDQEEEYKKRAQAMLDRFWENQKNLKTNTVELPDFIKVDLGEDFMLTGRLDWVEERSSETLHIVDFKTGEHEQSEEAIQLPIYGLILSRLFPGKSIAASYWYLEKFNDLKSYKMPNPSRTLEEILALGRVIKNTKLNGSFACQLGSNSCQYCRELMMVAEGGGKLVDINYDRKQEIYILKQTH